MANIQKLDLFTSNRIAAGEVVERPSSIVKELVENAIDAGATSIAAEIREGGIRSIRVADNGSGIEASDVLLAFERHATSKIHTPHDLDAIGTLGFRGEALSSIAAVAQVELITRTRDAEIGQKLKIFGGELQEHTAVGCPQGTSIVAEHIFFNTPARLKFLKKAGIEAGYIGDLLLRNIMANPQISFKYTNNGKIIYHSPGDGDLLTAIFCVYGRECIETLKRVDYIQDGITIQGYTCRSDAARSNRTYQSFFINGRYVQAPLLSKALQDAYGTRLMGGKFPLCALHISLPLENVDVNIHPNKLAVRFKNEKLMMEVIKQAIVQSLAEKNAVLWHYQDKTRKKEKSVIQSTMPEPVKKSADTLKTKEVVREQIASPIERRAELSRAEDVDTFKMEEIEVVPIDDTAIHQIKIDFQDTEIGQALVAHESVQWNDAQGEVAFALPDRPVRIIGQVFETYVILQQDERLFWIDQHAAHERMLFDQLTDETNFTVCQRLLLADEITLTPQQYAIIIEHEELLKSMGFDMICNEEKSKAYIYSVPQLFDQAETSEFLYECIDTLAVGGSMHASDLKRHRLATIACKHAIKANDHLTKHDMEVLIARFEDLGELNCPHGRPVIVCMTQREIEKMFKRIVT